MVCRISVLDPGNSQIYHSLRHPDVISALDLPEYPAVLLVYALHLRGASLHPPYPLRPL